MKEHEGKNLPATGASKGVATPTIDPLCVTDRDSESDPTDALSHGVGTELSGDAKTSKDPDMIADGCDSPTAEDTTDIGWIPSHPTETPKHCKVKLTKAAMPTDKKECCAADPEVDHTGTNALNEPAAGHGPDPNEKHCNSFHTGTSKIEAHEQNYLPKPARHDTTNGTSAHRVYKKDEMQDKAREE